jgi:hypothetical protein
MTRRTPPPSAQLAFDALLADTDAVNRTKTEHAAQAQKQAAFAHLPGTMDEAVPHYRALIERHHAAMLAGDVDTVVRLRQEANDLAYKLNRFEAGILANDGAPGCVLDRRTRAETGTVPLWGQSGSFEIQHKTMRVRIEMGGMLAIGAPHMSWLSFTAHAVEKKRPFLSDTGFRSFMGVGGDLCPGYTPDQFATGIIGAYVEKELKGRLKRIVPLTPGRPRSPKP